jgi:RNA polymerase sigma-70 factor (ECF subfamily)
MSYAEAAQVCGIDIGTVRSRLSRGRAQLADQLSRLGLLSGPGRVKEAS